MSIDKVLCLSGILVLSTTLIGATDVEVRFEGTVVVGFGSIAAGDLLSGRIVYDNTVAGFPGPSGMLYDAAGSFDFTVGTASYSLASPTGRILVENRSGGTSTDNLGFSSIPSGLAGPAMLGFAPGDAFLLLVGAVTTLFPTENLSDLPTSYSLADFPDDLFYLSFDAADGSSAGVVSASLSSLEAKPLVSDADGDGVPDDLDECPNSDLRPTVVSCGCDSGVHNDLLDTGCTVSDRIQAATAGAPNRAVYLVKLAKVCLHLLHDHVLTPEEVVRILRCAARWWCRPVII